MPTWARQLGRVAVPPSHEARTDIHRPRDAAQPWAMPERLLLVYAVLPLWWLAGALDWWMHRRTTIEANAGARESLLHLSMLAEMAVPILALLWLEADAGVLLLCVAAFLLHEITVLADLKWVQNRRRVTPFEQMVHSFQEILPLAAILLLCAGHWPQALAMLGLGNEVPVWTPRAKIAPLPPWQIAVVLCGSALVVGLYLEELARCLGKRRSGVRASSGAERAPRSPGNRSDS
jgi:hypothetical protein